jgi:hypothetical protein
VWAERGIFTFKPCGTYSDHWAVKIELSSVIGVERGRRVLSAGTRGRRTISFEARQLYSVETASVWHYIGAGEGPSVRVSAGKEMQSLFLP